jgi:acyl-CoA synthetase (AMP-forming)/AMP-acid ligase II
MVRVLVGAGSAPYATVAAASALMPHACIMSAYGMTEAASSITFDTLVSPACMHALHAPIPASKRSIVHKGKVVPTPKWLGKAQSGAIESHCVGLPAPGFQVAIGILKGDETSGSTITSISEVCPDARNLYPVSFLPSNKGISSSV